MKKILISLIGMAMTGVAIAKLPPLNDEAMAKAAAAKEKTVHGDKVSAYQLCLSQDKVVAKTGDKKGAQVVATPPCVNPGPFVASVTSGPVVAAVSPAAAPVVTAPVAAPVPAAVTAPAKK
jgi:hypothetical protein